MLGLSALVIALFVGLAVFRDYGISWDEYPVREFGVRYFAHQIPDRMALDSLRAADGFAWERHGPVMDLLLVWLERSLNLTGSASIFAMRHLVTYLVFLAGLAAVFAVLRRQHTTGRALFGVALIAATPLVFSHAFYNPKDIPFLALYAGVLWSLVRVIDAPTWPRLLVHVVLSALLVSTRVLGFFAVGFSVCALLWRRPTLQTVGQMAAYGAGVLLLLPLFWPVLWLDYVGVLSGALLNASANPLSPQSVLYWGQILPSSQLPWHYAPAMIAVTVPLAVLVLVIVGLPATVKGIWMAIRERATAPLDDAVIVVGGLTPLMLTIVLRPVQYDGWRHLLFVYPAIVFIAVRGAAIVADWVQSTTVLRRVSASARGALLVGGALACLTPTFRFMLRAHPFEQVYFNALGGPTLEQARERFDFEYWGVSYRRMLEEVLARDHADVVRVSVANFPGVVNSLLLPDSSRRRLQYAPRDSASWFITNFRYRNLPVPPDSLAAVKLVIDGATVAVAYDLRGRSGR